MSALFRSIDDPDMRPFAEPLGRFLLAYSRACSALVTLAQRLLLLTKMEAANEDGVSIKAELEAARIVNDIQNMPKRIRRLCRDKLSLGQFEQIDKSVTRIKEVSPLRNQLVHAEWWDVRNGEIATRNVYQDEIKHGEPIKIESLTDLAAELDAIATKLDHLDDAVRQAAQNNTGSKTT